MSFFIFRCIFKRGLCYEDIVLTFVFSTLSRCNKFAIKAMENNILAGLITFATAFSAALKLLEEREV